MVGTLILHSGGMNSTIALYLALKDKTLEPPYHALTFKTKLSDTYETGKAEDIFKQAIAPFVSKECIAVSNLDELPRHKIINISGDYFCSETYIKLLHLLAIATGYAITHSLKDIVIGISSTEAGYSRQEEDFIFSMEKTIRLATGLSNLYTSKPNLVTPLIDADKADLFKTANTLGILQIIVDETTSCRYFDREFRQFDWGKGCGGCYDCQQRGDGWRAYLKDAKRWKDQEQKLKNKVKIGNITYTGVGDPARWVILDRDDNGKSSIVMMHGKERLFTKPTDAWDWVRQQQDTDKFYSVVGQETAKHVVAKNVEAYG